MWPSGRASLHFTATGSKTLGIAACANGPWIKKWDRRVGDNEDVCSRGFRHIRSGLTHPIYSDAAAATEAKSTDPISRKRTPGRFFQEVFKSKR